MAKRGQKAKPTKLHELHGTKNTTRHAGIEPRFDGDIGPAPDYLPPYAEEFWERVRIWLTEMGVGQQPDELGLENAAMLYHRLRTANDYIAEHGTVIEYRGKRVRAPEAIDALACGKELRMWYNEVGLTPSARAAMRRPESDPDEEEFFGMRAV